MKRPRCSTVPSLSDSCLPAPPLRAAAWIPWGWGALGAELGDFPKSLASLSGLCPGLRTQLQRRGWVQREAAAPAGVSSPGIGSGTCPCLPRRAFPRLFYVFILLFR